MDWDTCEHEWKDELDGSGTNDLFTDVKCIKCRVPGQKTNKTDEVFWPAT